jgi:Holliday junction resolvase
VSAKSRGSARERQVADWLRDRDYFVVKVGGSLGAADLLACRARPREVLLVQVKSDKRGPFEHFGPKDRAELLAAAEKAGGLPVLAWWPARGQLRWFDHTEWPAVRAAA